MKTILSLPLSPNARAVVQVGDVVKPHAVVAQEVEHTKDTIIHMSKLLNVDESHIASYLTAVVGEPVSGGTIIARKKKFLSERIIRSPASGVIKEMDLKSGTLTFTISSEVTKTKETIPITSPIGGVVSHIDKTAIAIEVDGRLYKGKKGEGENVSGRLYIFGSSSPIGIFDIQSDVEGGIILCQSLSQEAIIKLDVLGANGLIVQQGSPKNSLPWIQVSEDTFDTLADKKGALVWLQPQEHHIIVVGVSADA